MLITAEPASAASLVIKSRSLHARRFSRRNFRQAAHDPHSAQIAYALLRNLEKQLWLLRPHTMGSAHPFPFTTLSA